MISILCYCGSRNELNIIWEIAKDLAARYSEEKWDIHSFSSLEDVKEFLAAKPLINMACFDVTTKGSLSYLGEIRKDYKEMLLMLLADSSLSPMEYVRPDILASSLILRPLCYEVCKDKWKDMILEYLSCRREEEVFILNTREGKTRIPYHQIYYLEARNKKVYLRLQCKELAFYGTLDELEEKLPQNFLRCHRAFLVNSTHIENVRLSQGEIILAYGMTIPLSRSYKTCFREFILTNRNI